MTRRAAAIGALAGVALAWGLGAGALRALPAGLRVTLALAALVWLPGLGWQRVIGARPPGGLLLAAPWALGCGVAWLGLCVLVTRTLGMPFTALAHAGAPWTAVPWIASAWLAPRAADPSPPAGAGLPKPAAIAIALASLLALLHVARAGPAVTYLSDTPDHVGTVRRMLASGDAFPKDAFFRDAGPAGVDPRKGLWHSGVALVCALSHADPLVAWHALSAWMAALLVVTGAGFAWWLGGPLAAAAGAWGTLLGYGGGLGAPYLGEAVFATKLADQLALATAAAMLLDLQQRSLRSRVNASALALGTVFVHVFGAIQFAIVFAALALGLLARDRGGSRTFQRLVWTALACAAATAPYLAWRAHGAYAPVNPIHTETQGMLELARGVRIVSVGAVWDWLGPLWVLFPLSLVWWARNARDVATLYLLTTTLAVGTLMLVPPVVSLLEPRLGYLLMRLPWLLPVGPAVAFLVVRAQAAWRAGRRFAALAPAGVLALALTAPVADAANALVRGAPRAGPLADARLSRWADALAWMDRGLPAGSVVLSDPGTCYSVPAFTRHWVTCLADQHSSPNDSLALARILDARDALDPHAPWARTAQVVRRWGATAIALNGRFPASPELDYWSPGPGWYEAARARLDGAPKAFEKLYERDRFSVYAIHRDALDLLPAGGTARPYVRAHGQTDVAVALGRALPELVTFGLAPAQAAHGDTVRGHVEWWAATPLRAGAYRVALRFDRPLPAGVPPAPEAVSKLWRKLVEHARHERYRFRADHLPLGGDYGVDRWGPGEVVRDTFAFVVPGDVAAGDYVVKLSMQRQPHYPNLSLRDFLSDDDLLDGVAVSRLHVAAGGGR